MANKKTVTTPEKQARVRVVPATAAKLVARTAVDGVRSLREQVEARVSGRKRDRDALASALSRLESEYLRVVAARRAVTASRGASIARRTKAAAPRSGGAREATEETKRPEVAFVPTPPELVGAMLEMAAITSDDVVYDLGSGDGRIVIAAAKQYGATGVGIDIDAERIAEATARAAQEGVADRVTFVENDLFDADIRAATVVMLYLLPAVNMELRQQLLDQLRPGTRIVSHAFDMGDWPAAEKRDVEGRQLYLWIVPEREAA